jgi:hypothetical protein
VWLSLGEKLSALRSLDYCITELIVWCAALPGREGNSDASAESKDPELEQELRENIIRRRGVYSFKIGGGSAKSHAAPQEAVDGAREGRPSAG